MQGTNCIAKKKKGRLKVDIKKTKLRYYSKIPVSLFKINIQKRSMQGMGAHT